MLKVIAANSDNGIMCSPTVCLGIGDAGANSRNSAISPGLQSNHTLSMEGLAG